MGGWCHILSERMISKESWFDRGKFLEINGRQIFTIDEGAEESSGGSALPEKETIVFIHGFPTASWDWVKLWPELTQHYRCIAMDLLGFGFSDKPKNYNYSIIEQADIVEAIVQEKVVKQKIVQKNGSKKFHVLSHDYGDTVAQELLARQNSGEGVGEWLSLCLLNGGLFPETHRALLVQKLLLSPLGSILSALMSKGSFIKSFSATFGEHTQPTDAELNTFWELIQHKNGRRNFHKLIRYMVERIENRERWVGAFTQSKIPVALINGSADPISGSHMVDRYLEVVGKPDVLVCLDGIGHYPQIEAAADVLKHYKAFIIRSISNL